MPCLTFQTFRKLSRLSGNFIFYKDFQENLITSDLNMIFVGGLERCPPGGLSAWRPGEVSAWRLVLRRLVRRRDVPRRLVFWRGVLRRQRPKYQLEECPLEACPPGGLSAWRRVLLEACPTGGLSAGEMTANREKLQHALLLLAIAFLHGGAS